MVSARTQIGTYAPFAADSQSHLEQVLARNAVVWTVHDHYDEFRGWYKWACRSDGLFHYCPDSGFRPSSASAQKQKVNSPRLQATHGRCTGTEEVWI